MRHNKLLKETAFLAAVVLSCIIVGGSPLNAGDVKQNNTEKKSENKTGDKENGSKTLEKDAESGERIGIPSRDYSDKEFAPQKDDEGSMVWMFFEVILILGLMGFGFYAFFRFVSKKSGVSTFGQEVLNILSVVPIGQNKFLQIVDLAGKVMVLGISDNNINLITEITNKDEIDRIRILCTRNNEKVKGSFQENIKKHLGGIINRFSDKSGQNESVKFNEEYRKDMESGVDLNYLKKQKERLKDLNGKK